MKKLNWKKKYLSDKSGFWYETSVKPLGWSYVVDMAYKTDVYTCVLFINGFAEETLISKKKFKKLEAAKLCCEKHLNAVAKLFNNFLKSK